MLAKLLSFVLAFAPESPCSNKEYAQCGGKSFSGDTCCQEYDNCTVVNQYYSQCMPKDLCLVPDFGQCGGTDKHGAKWDPKKACCPPSFECKFKDQYYSQCLPVVNPNATCAQAYAQCGGKEAKGGKPWGSNPGEYTCCIAGYECVKDNEYYSGCKPEPICENARFGQCGGVDTKGLPWTKANGYSDCCPEDFHCAVKDPYYSQCVKNGTATTA